jgi:hypothetical protein
MKVDPFDSLLVINNALEKVTRKTYSIIHSKQITKITPMFTLADTKRFLVMTLDLAAISHDEENDCWKASDEPIPSIEDVCARGSLDIEEVTAVENVESGQSKLKSTFDSRISFGKTLRKTISGLKKNKKTLITFRIPNDYVETPLDIKIKELRKVMKAEEMKRLEEEKFKECLKLKEKELQEARKKKGGEGILSYDLTGRLTEAATIPSIPSMMISCGLPKIQQANPIEDKARMILRKTLMKSKVKKKTNKEATDIAMLILESKKLVNKTERVEAGKMFTLRGVYDSFNPVAGVTFCEVGKNTKESNLTFKDKAGRISKSEFQTYLSEGSFNPTTILSMNTSTWSNKLEKTDKQVDYTGGKFSKRVEKVDRVDVTGDLAQLWEGGYELEQGKGEVSINPGMYVHPAKKGLVQDSQRYSSKTDIDLFNLTVTSEFESAPQSTRGPSKLLEISVVNNKKVVRERVMGGYGIRLPPPPLGKSTGHGL